MNILNLKKIIIFCNPVCGLSHCQIHVENIRAWTVNFWKFLFHGIHEQWLKTDLKTIMVVDSHWLLEQIAWFLKNCVFQPLRKLGTGVYLKQTLFDTIQQTCKNITTCLCLLQKIQSNSLKKKYKSRNLFLSCAGVTSALCSQPNVNQ